jgi:hypothetical protein
MKSNGSIQITHSAFEAEKANQNSAGKVASGAEHDSRQLTANKSHGISAPIVDSPRHVNSGFINGKQG